MTLATTSWGKGSPLAMLHGFTGAGSSFDHLRDALGTLHHVIVPDLPGHGHSPEATSWDATLADLAETLPPQPVFVAGYSMGARLGLAFALRWPERVRALVLESGSPGIDDPGERGSRRAEDERLAEQVMAEGVPAFVARWELHPTLATLRELPAAVAASLRERRLRNSAAGLASALRHLGSGAQPSLWDELPRLRCPVLLIAGERDAKFVEVARRMASAIPGARLSLIPSSGHASHLEAPEPYASALVAFFKKHGGDRQ
jgi:2-succinyl-6-hydroxy-2,4-cyclohexadiene-1-carboxylate synthase